MTVKTNTTINTEAWDKLKKQIEYHLKQDNNLTAITNKILIYTFHCSIG